jgi:hypothetical protein
MFGCVVSWTVTQTIGETLLGLPLQLPDAENLKIGKIIIGENRLKITFKFKLQRI